MQIRGFLWVPAAFCGFLRKPASQMLGFSMIPGGGLQTPAKISGNWHCEAGLTCSNCPFTCVQDQGAKKGSDKWMRLFLLTVGSFLLTVELFYLQLTILASLLTIGAFLLTILASLLTVDAFLLTMGKCV